MRPWDFVSGIAITSYISIWVSPLRGDIRTFLLAGCFGVLMYSFGHVDEIRKHCKRKQKAQP